MKTAVSRTFATAVDSQTIDRAAEALEANGFSVHVVDTLEQAKEEVERLVPKGSEVYTNTSKTTEHAGIKDLLDESGDYDSVRKRTDALDFTKDRREIVKRWATPEYMVGSVHALTEDGHALIASRSNSQLPGYANGAAHVVWVVGAQKIVTSVEEGIKRINEYVVPLEDQRVKEVYGPTMGTKVNSILIKYAEDNPRTTVILVREAAGF